MAAIIRISPSVNEYALVTPFLADRVTAYAAEHLPDVEPQEFTRNTMSRLWAGDPSVLALGILDEKGMLVGHVLAECAQVGSQRVVVVHQSRADQNVGTALQEALEATEAWALQAGANVFKVMPHRDWKTWEKKGFQLATHTVYKRLKRE